MPTPSIQRRWKNLPGEPVGDAGDPYTGYDRFGRTEQMRWIKPHSGDSGFDTLVNVQWGYNRASQKTWRKDLLAPASSGQDQHFGYDGLYQVTERQRGLLNVNTTAVGGVPAQVENFSYDETGNWITYRQVNDGVLGIDETRVNNRSNQMTQVDGSSAGVSYDKNGNMLTVPTGDGLTGSSRKLEWDAWNRLMKVSDEDDNVLAEYEYDGLSRRTKVKAGGVTRHFYYDDQWRVVEERLDDATTPEKQYVWHPTNRWELLFRDRSTANDGTLDERLYSLKDQLDPVAICDTSGSVVERYDYTAFGIPTFLNADFTPKEGNVSAFDWNFLFHAEFADKETGWFNYGYRYYVPKLGRWLTRDPIGIQGGVNLYGMVGNNPVNWIDHFGLLNKFTGKCEVVLFIGHNNGDIEGGLSEWNILHQAVLKEQPGDPSQASGLACSLPKGCNKPYGIPGFVSSGNTLIGWGPEGRSANGGMTPANDPKNGFDNDKESREAFGFLKLVLTNYHAALLSADAFAEHRLGCCPDGITMRLFYYSDIVPKDPANHNKPFGAATFNGAVNHLGRLHQFAEPNLRDLPKMPMLHNAVTPPPECPTTHVEVLFKKK